MFIASLLQLESAIVNCICGCSPPLQMHVTNIGPPILNSTLLWLNEASSCYWFVTKWLFWKIMLTATLNCFSERDVCESQYSWSDHPHRVSHDNPQKALKIPRFGTGFKCPAISQINSFFLKSMWQHCLAATLNAHCTTICTLGTVWKTKQSVVTLRKLLYFGTWKLLSVWMNYAKNFML